VPTRPADPRKKIRVGAGSSVGVSDGTSVAVEVGSEVGVEVASGPIEGSGSAVGV
jgi:hypothetical protein